MQSEAIKYQPPAEGIVVTQEEEQQILKLGRIHEGTAGSEP